MTIDITPVQLRFADPTLLPLLFGDHDRNLARIEQKLTVSIAGRGDVVAIDGAAEQAAKAKQTLEVLYERLHRERRKGRTPEGLSMAMVDAACNFADSGERMTTDAGDPDTIDTWKRPIEPRSAGQRHFVKAMREKELVFGVGPAGTGKTYLAVAMAVAMLKRQHVERIILSRPAVEAGERLGFLPGDMKEKIDPYLRPLYDALYDTMPGDQVEKRLKNGEIEVAPLAFMRGRTLANAFIILDEAQNTTPTQMKMFLTRLGENSRMAVTGDPSQVDLPFGAKSGLTDALGLLDGVSGVAVSRFTNRDVVRHPLVTRIVKAYDKRESSLFEPPAAAEKESR